MRRLSFAHRARQDLIGIEAYWRDRDDLIVGFYAAIDLAANFLKQTPGAGAPIEGAGRRKWRVGKTPFLLIYRATRTELRILRVVHQSQNWRQSL